MAKQAVDQSTQELILDEEWRLYEQAKAAISALEKKMESCHKGRIEQKAKLLELKAGGIDYAGTTYKDGKYLYLIYPATKNEARKRIYVGQDKELIEAALAKLKRGAEYLRVEAKVQNYEYQMQKYLRELNWM